MSFFQEKCPNLAARDECKNELSRKTNSLDGSEYVLRSHITHISFDAIPTKWILFSVHFQPLLLRFSQHFCNYSIDHKDSNVEKRRDFVKKIELYFRIAPKMPPPPPPLSCSDLKPAQTYVHHHLWRWVQKIVVLPVILFVCFLPQSHAGDPLANMAASSSNSLAS